MITRTGIQTSGQISKMGVISNLATTDFTLPTGGFLIKNDGLTYVTLDIIPAMGDTDTVVTTLIAPGWNPELVKIIKSNVSLASVNLKWGY